jgi:hypothetical protein
MKFKSVFRTSGKSSPTSHASLLMLAVNIAAFVVFLSASSTIYGQSSAPDEVTIPRAQYEQIKAAVDELAAARPYIRTLEAERDQRIEIDKLRDRETAALTRVAELAGREAAAERRAREALESALATETRRAEMLEREFKRKGGGLSTSLKIAAVVVGALVLLK